MRAHYGCHRDAGATVGLAGSPNCDDVGDTNTELDSSAHSGEIGDSDIVDILCYSGNWRIYFDKFLAFSGTLQEVSCPSAEPK